jgi:hypothetical protein
VCFAEQPEQLRDPAPNMHLEHVYLHFRVDLVNQARIINFFYDL